MNPTDMPEWVDKTLYPFSTSTVQTRHGKMHFIDEGPEDQKRKKGTVLMVHGNPQWSIAYRDLVSELKSDYRCVVPDLLGFGLSDKNPDLPYTLDMHIETITDLMNALDNPKDVTLVLHDWGGPIGLSQAVNKPDSIKNIVLLNTWSWPMTADIKQYNIFDRLYFWGFSKMMGGPIGSFLTKKFNGFINFVLPLAISKNFLRKDNIIEQYRKVHHNTESRKAMIVFPAQILDASITLHTIWNKRELFSEKKIRILWGNKDIAFRAKELRVWKENIPSAEVTVLKDVGHCPLEEDTEKVCSETRLFLDQN